MSLASTPQAIFVAAHEGVAYRIGQIYALLSPMLEVGHDIVANGGALVRSPAWVQMVADVLGRTIRLSDVEEASARGAAMLALKNMGAVSSLPDFPAFIGRRFDPDPEKHAIYAAGKERQESLYKALY